MAAEIAKLKTELKKRDVVKLTNSNNKLKAANILLRKNLADLKPKKGTKKLQDEDVESDDENGVDQDDDGNVEYDENSGGQFFVLFSTILH